MASTSDVGYTEKNSSRVNRKPVTPIRIIAVAILLVGIFPTLYAQRPNLLFIAVDDLRPQLGCYGETWMKTPNIDRLASTARIFNRHYVQVATCGASRHALLTGLRPTVEADYGNGPFSAHKEELAERDTESFAHLFKIVNAYAQLERPTNEPVTKNKGYPFESAPVDDEGYPDGWIAEHAVAALNDIKDEPFLLAVGFMKPHLPFNAPTRYWDIYDPQQIPSIPYPEIPDGIDPRISLHPSFELVGQYDVPEGALEDEAYIRNLRHAYCAAVSYVDAQIGKVLDELDRLNLSSNTIVVLWGDHGWHLGDLGTWGKHTAFEYALRSPLLIKVPGMSAPGRKSEALVESVDIYPTLAELFSLNPPEGLQGEQPPPRRLRR